MTAPEDNPQFSESSETDSFDEGVATVDAENNGQDKETYAQQCALARKWLDKIKKARAFDENARKQMVIDRRYLRGDTRFEVSVPLAPSYIEILTSILYAKNPDLDVAPAPSTTPPPMASIIEMARDQILADPQTHEKMIQVGEEAERTAGAAEHAAAATGGDPPPLPPPGVLGEKAAQTWLDLQIKEKAKDLMKPYRRALEDAKQFGKTIDIVVSDAWNHAKLKRKAKKQLRSTLSVGAGWIKATWQDRTGTDSVMPSTPNDAKSSLDRIAATADKIDQPHSPQSTEADQATLAAQQMGLQGDKRTLHRGFVLDFIPAQDIQVDSGLSSLEDYTDASWIAHRLFRPVSKAKIEFPDVKDKLDSAQKYYQQKPRDPTAEKLGTDPGSIGGVDANEADAFRTNSNVGTTAGQDDPDVAIWEIQSKDDNIIYTAIEGVPCFARQPYSPNVPSTRFYNLFQLAFHWLDNERHPDSIIKRIAPLLDEVNAIHSDARTHRRRAIPKTLFNSAEVAPEQVAKVEGATSNELVGLDLTNPKADVGKVFKNFAYPQFDPKLYNDSSAKAEIETATGVQEALSSSIMTAKTATEAEIQQTGTNARTGFQHDEIDEGLDDLATYTAEVLVQKYTHEDVTEIAGAWAFWPGQGNEEEEGSEAAQPITLDRMHSLITVKIKAGSSGKPNTSQQQQAWAVSLPLLSQAVTEIGQLRGSSPQDMADCKEELVQETLSRAGERLDPTRFIPQAPSQEPGAMQTPPPGMMPGPGAPPPQGPQPMPATIPAPSNSHVLPVPHKGHITQQNRSPAELGA